MMKAYKAWDEKSDYQCSTIVFAENIKEAKKFGERSKEVEDSKTF